MAAKKMRCDTIQCQSFRPVEVVLGKVNFLLPLFSMTDEQAMWRIQTTDDNAAFGHAEIMNHPTQNKWLLYVDGDAAPENVARLRKHLETCPLCALEVAGWKRSAQKLKRRPCPASSRIRRDRNPDPLWVSTHVRWGIAAASVLFVGFAFGRLSATRTHALEQTAAAFHPALRRLKTERSCQILLQNQKIW
jgi:hypothetical protein